MTTQKPVVSAPGLMAAFCAWPSLPLGLLAPELAREALVPMYRIDEHDTTAEAVSAARVAGEIAERLRRLAGAYAAWPTFEPGPYFDLRPAQANLLVRVTERVSTVHVVFAVDALLPAFQAVVDAGVALPPTVRPGSATDEAAWEEITHRWQYLQDVLTEARRLLAGDIGFLATNAAEEERNQWRPYWRERCAGMLGNPGLSAVPTLTLATEFPLPAARQPHRLRRLRRAWEHRRRGKRPPGHSR